MHGRRFAKRGGIAANTPAAWPPRERGRPLSSVSSTAAGEGAHGWGRARDGVESPWMSWRIAQGWRALRIIPCRRPLASAGAGKFESAASTQVGSLRSAGSLEPAGWYSVSVFRGRRLGWGVLSATLRFSAGFADSAPKRHRPHSAFGGALNFCLIKHLQDRAGEKHYRCEAGP